MRMTLAYYEQSRQLWAVLKKKKLLDFDEQDEVSKEIQLSGMRAAYAALAIRGGGKPEPIGDDDA